MKFWCVETREGIYYMSAERCCIDGGALYLVNYPGDAKREELVLGFGTGNWTRVYNVQSDKSPRFEFRPAAFDGVTAKDAATV